VINYLYGENILSSDTFSYRPTVSDIAHHYIARNSLCGRLFSFMST